MQNTALSAFLIFCDRVVYPTYARAPRIFGMSVFEDQAAAGAIMWVPGSFAFLIPLAFISITLMSRAVVPPAFLGLRRRRQICRDERNKLLRFSRRVKAMLSDRLKWILVHSTRTAVVAVVSLLVARFFGLPEAYWAPITTLVITQSSLGAALFVSWQRFVGTVVGALVGATAASYFGPHALVFGICVFILGLLRAVTWSDLTAYRFGSVTLAVVLLVPRTGPAWQIAFHRFAEVSIGIGVALILAIVWPEREATPSEKS